MLPDDLTSYLWGAASVALVWFISSFIKAAGKDAWGWVKNKANPTEPDPIKVGGKFVPKTFPPGECAWVGQDKVYNYEEKDYFYYPHPKNGAKCYRETYSGHIKKIEWLLVKPGTGKVT